MSEKNNSVPPLSLEIERASVKCSLVIRAGTRGIGLTMSVSTALTLRGRRPSPPLTAPFVHPSLTRAPQQSNGVHSTPIGR